MKKLTKNERIKKQKFLFGYAICELVLLILLLLLVFSEDLIVRIGTIFLVFTYFPILLLLIPIIYFILYNNLPEKWDIGKGKELFVDLFCVFNLILLLFSFFSFFISFRFFFL